MQAYLFRLLYYLFLSTSESGNEQIYMCEKSLYIRLLLSMDYFMHDHNTHVDGNVRAADLIPERRTTVALCSLPARLSNQMLCSDPIAAVPGFLTWDLLFTWKTHWEQGGKFSWRLFFLNPTSNRLSSVST